MEVRATYQSGMIRDVTDDIDIPAKNNILNTAGENIGITVRYRNPNDKYVTTTQYIDVGYVISFNQGNGAGGTAPASINAIPGKWYDLPENTFTVPTGKYFKGWSESANSASVVSGNRYKMGSYDKTFYAYFDNDTNSNVIYFKDGSETKKTVVIPKAVEWTIPECDFDVPSGKVFKYWEYRTYLDYSGEGEYISYKYPGEKILDNSDYDRVLRAVWVDRPSVYPLAIYVDTPPDRTVWDEGEQFQTNGMVVKIHWSDGTYEVVPRKHDNYGTGYTISPTGNLPGGTDRIYINYTAETEDGIRFPLATWVYIRTRYAMTELKVLEPPYKTEYMIGEAFDPAGMVVAAVFADGSEEIITDYYAWIDNTTARVEADTEYARLRIWGGSGYIFTNYPITVAGGSGIEVSGTVKSYGNKDDFIRVLLEEYSENVGAGPRYYLECMIDSGTEVSPGCCTAEYGFENVPQGKYNLSASKSGHITRTYVVEVGPGGLELDIELWLDGEVTAVTLNKTELQLAAGASETLTPTFAPAEYGSELTWASDDEDVATVDGNGTVTAVAEGTATVTATTSNNKTATCEVTVIEGVSVSGTVIARDDKDNMTVCLYPSDMDDADISSDIKDNILYGIAADLGSITENSDGKRYDTDFTFDGVEPGEYKLAVYKPGGYIIFIAEISVSVGCEGAAVELELTVGVRGTVKSYNPGKATALTLYASTDTAHITPLYTAVIDAAAGSGQAEQSFSFTGVAAGTYDLVITKDGHLTYTVTGVVVDNEDLDLTALTSKPYSNIILPAGDVNGDGSITEDDVSVVRYTTNINKTTEAAADKLADVNGDGSVTEDDVSIIRYTTHINRSAAQCTYAFCAE